MLTAVCHAAVSVFPAPPISTYILPLFLLYSVFTCLVIFCPRMAYPVILFFCRIPLALSTLAKPQGCLFPFLFWHGGDERHVPFQSEHLAFMIWLSNFGISRNIRDMCYCITPPYHSTVPPYPRFFFLPAFTASEASFKCILANSNAGQPSYSTRKGKACRACQRSSKERPDEGECSSVGAADFL